MNPIGQDMAAPPWMGVNPNVVPPMQTMSSPPSSAGMGMAIRPRGPPKQPKQFKEGDWECPEPTCGNINFSKRTKCNRCGIPRPIPVLDPTPAPHLGGPPGLFKQGDWACQQCGNVNWARRDKCNICNANKITIKTEPRTGRAGGHFDLQDPADRKEHHSDDEEYDEFGRKKKQKKPQKSNSNDYHYSSSYSSYTKKAKHYDEPNFDGELKIAFPSAPKERSRSGSFSSPSSSSSSRRSSRRSSSFSSSSSPSHYSKKSGRHENKVRDVVGGGKGADKDGKREAEKKCKYGNSASAKYKGGGISGGGGGENGGTRRSRSRSRSRGNRQY